MVSRHHYSMVIKYFESSGDFKDKVGLPAESKRTASQGGVVTCWKSSENAEEGRTLAWEPLPLSLMGLSGPASSREWPTV